MLRFTFLKFFNIFQKQTTYCELLRKEYQKIAANTNDYKECVKAFLEKRKPNFKGN